MPVRLAVQTLILLFAAAAAGSAAANRGRLTVVIHGFAGDDGVAKIAVADSADGFPKTGAVRSARATIQDGVATAVFDSLPVGAYAVSAFHDENDNGKLDFRFYGAPKERYGFSNGARGRFGPPDFSDAAFRLSKGENRIEIAIR